MNIQSNCFPSSIAFKVQRGMSLVELMIAMLLSLIIVAALAEVFVNMSRSTQELAKTNSQIENARFAKQYLRNDIVHAGYWGGFIPEFDDLSFLGVPTDLPRPPVNVPDPCRDFADWDEPSDPDYDEYRDGLLGIPVESRNDLPSDCSSLLSRLDDDDASDVLIVRHASMCSPGEDNCEDMSGGDLYFQASNCESEGFVYALDPNEPSLTKRDCSTQETVRRFVQSIYYIRNYTNAEGDGVPALVRSRFSTAGHVSPAEVLVEGIERFRVELGIDGQSATGDSIVYSDYQDEIDWPDDDYWVAPTNRGDGIPESYVHCGSGCTLDQLLNVVAVKLYVLARANKATAGYVDNKDYVLGGHPVSADDLDDQFKRHVFSTTVRLNNVSGRRETPDPNSVPGA